MPQRDLDSLFERLASSSFRRRIHLSAADRDYVMRHGLQTVIDHARKIIDERLGPGVINNDGRQTPWRGHPVFLAQHATATCCRGCLAKWHGIRKGAPLSPSECDYVVAVIERWIGGEVPGACGRGAERTLFD